LTKEAVLFILKAREFDYLLHKRKGRMNTMKRTISVLLALLMVFGVFTMAVAAENEADISLLSNPFTDVTIDWYTPYVQFVYDEGIMQGKTATTFAPQAYFSRAQVAATLFRIYHDRVANQGDARDNSFADVPYGEWFAPYVTWAANNGIVTGATATIFNPNNAAARQEFATMLHRYAEFIDCKSLDMNDPSLDAFVDAGDIAVWARDAMEWASYRGIITGVTANTIVPEGTAVRAQAAAILTRFLTMEIETPQPQRVNIADMLERNFAEVRHLFGTLIGTEDVYEGRWYDFDTGVSVLISSGHIIFVEVWHDNESSLEFYMNTLDHTSFRSDVAAALGTPCEMGEYDGFALYLYNNETLYRSFIFFFDQDGSVLMFGMAVGMWTFETYRR
jgi:hypothetical protein